MARTRFKIRYIGRGSRLSAKMSALLEGAGYSVSAPRRPLAHERLGDGIGTWIGADVTAAQLATLLADAGTTRKRSRLFTVELTSPRPGARHAHDGRGSTALSKSAMTLQELRESFGRTQGEVARRVAMTQPQLSRVEARSDHLTSTLRKYVRALGGRVEVVAHVGGARIVLEDV